MDKLVGCVHPNAGQTYPMSDLERRLNALLPRIDNLERGMIDLQRQVSMLDRKMAKPESDIDRLLEGSVKIRGWLELDERIEGILTRIAKLEEHVSKGT